MNIYGLGSMWTDEATKLTVSPFDWTTAEIEPVTGDLLIAFVECSTEWACPSGWTQNGEVVCRVLAGGFEGNWVFQLLGGKRGSMKLHLALGRRVADDDIWAQYRSARLWAEALEARIDELENKRRDDSDG